MLFLFFFFKCSLPPLRSLIQQLETKESAGSVWVSWELKEDALQNLGLKNKKMALGSPWECVSSDCLFSKKLLLRVLHIPVVDLLEWGDLNIGLYHTGNYLSSSGRLWNRRIWNWIALKFQRSSRVHGLYKESCMKYLLCPSSDALTIFTSYSNKQCINKTWPLSCTLTFCSGDSLK